MLDVFLVANPVTGKLHRQYGGTVSRATGQFIPTLRTALFLLSGGDQEFWLKMHARFTVAHPLFVHSIVNLLSVDAYENYLPNRVLQLDSAYTDYLFNGVQPRLDAGDQFPARLIQTNKTLDDLVLPPRVMEQLEPALNYAKVHRQLYDQPEVAAKVNSGFVLMLYGPPGTGKTFSVSVIGNAMGLDVYVIDASLLISKYIGETEKNITRVFERLKNKNCIIFFDEADALFGKRTEVTDAKDRYANQETSHLLQIIEQAKALVVLSTNHQQNIDEAFQRRIISKVFIGPPGDAERLQLWQKALPEGYTYASDQFVEQVAANYAFTGANIAVIIKMCVEKAFSEQKKSIMPR